MPATPGTSTLVEVDPAIGLASSDTWDPEVGIEAGRTYVAPTPTVFGGGGTDTINVTAK